MVDLLQSTPPLSAMAKASRDEGRARSRQRQATRATAHRTEVESAAQRRALSAKGTPPRAPPASTVGVAPLEEARGDRGGAPASVGGAVATDEVSACGAHAAVAAARSEGAPSAAARVESSVAGGDAALAVATPSAEDARGRVDDPHIRSAHEISAPERRRLFGWTGGWGKKEGRRTGFRPAKAARGVGRAGDRDERASERADRTYAGRERPPSSRPILSSRPGQQQV